MGLRIINPGLCTTVQDLGRVGYREWGVPVAGSFDQGAAALANALLANPYCCAVLELTLVGGSYEAQIPLALCLAGAPMVAALITGEGSRGPLTIPLSFPLRPGERLVLGGSATGARTYLAVRGGWQTPIVLGSRSQEDRLQAGDLLPARPGTTPVRRPSEGCRREPAAEAIRLIDGPDASPSFPAEFWNECSFRVGRQSDRMGIRLEGVSVPEVRQPDRISMPVAPGAVQVAGSLVLILGAACGTMGGYPHVAHVISADLDRVGQLRPGEGIRFRRITLDEARRIDRQVRSADATRLRRIATLAADGVEVTAHD